jgi:hypothetical protein
MPQPQFTPSVPSAEDITVMTGGNTAIFYAYWDPNRSPGRDPLDRAKVRQNPVFKCRSGFDVFTAVPNGALPPGVVLETDVSDRQASIYLTTSQKSFTTAGPTRLEVEVTCTTKGGQSVLPHHNSRTKQDQPVPLENQYLPYPNFWLPTTRVFTLQLIVHVKDEPWVEGPVDELDLVVELGRFTAVDYEPQTTLKWEAGTYPQQAVIAHFFHLISDLNVGGGAPPRDHDYADWIIKPIYLYDQWGQKDLTKFSGLYVRFPGIGSNPGELTGLTAQGPVTIWGVPRLVGNTALDINMLWDATYAYRFFQGWEAYGTWKRVTIPITIVEKFLPPGRAVVLHKTPQHLEDRFWMTSSSNELGSNTLGGSWSDKADPRTPAPGGGFPVEPTPAPPPSPIPEPPAQEGSFTLGGTIVTGIDTTDENVKVGSIVSSDNLPEGTIVTEVGDGYVVVSSPATAGGTATVIFNPPADTIIDETEDYSQNEPGDHIIITDTTTNPGTGLYLVPVVVSADMIDVPTVSTMDMSFRPLALAAYPVGSGIDSSTSGDPGDTGILSAFGWPYLHNPSPEIVAPDVDMGDPWVNGLALAPYPVGDIGAGGPDGADPAILSAFVYRYAYNPSDDVTVDAVELPDRFPYPYNLIPPGPDTGGTGILSAFGFQYLFNPADDMQVPDVTVEDLGEALGIRVSAGIQSAFGYAYLFNPADDVVVPAVPLDEAVWLNGLEAHTESWKVINSAFGYPVPYFPANDVQVPAVAFDLELTGIALSPYPAGPGLPSGTPAGDPGIVSAFMYRDTYVPGVDIPVLRAYLGVDNVISAMGFPQHRVLADDYSAPAVYGFADDAYMPAPDPAPYEAQNEYEQTEPSARGIVAGY